MLCALEPAARTQDPRAGRTEPTAPRARKYARCSSQVAIYCGVPAGVDASVTRREVFAELDKKIAGKLEAMLKGKWALVTGATAGLGLAVAESLAGAGANIVLHDLTEPAQTRDRLRAHFGVEVSQRCCRPVAARLH